MSFKPKGSEAPQSAPRDPNYDPSTFVAPEPEEGLRPAAISMIVSLGVQKRDPYNKKDNNGNDLLDAEGNEIVISPDPNEQVVMYADLLDDEHDYGEEIGVQQIRQPIHREFAGKIEGLNFKEVGHFTPEGEYIKGKPWTLPPAGQFAKLSKACGVPQIMDAGGYGADTNPHKSDISLLLGKPFLVNVEVSKTTKENRDGVEVTYVNVSLKDKVPMMKGMEVPAMNAEPFALGMSSDVADIKKNFKFIKAPVVRKIMAALDYHNVNFDDEAKPVVPSNMKVVFEELGVNQWGRIEAQKPAESEGKAKPKAKKKAAPKPKEKPVEAPAEEDFDDDVPF